MLAPIPQYPIYSALVRLLDGTLVRWVVVVGGGGALVSWLF